MPTAARDGPGRSDKTSGQNPGPARDRKAASARISAIDRGTMNPLIESVRRRFPDAVSASHTYRGDATVVLRRTFLLEVARFLKEDAAAQMNYLIDLTAV